MNGVALRRSDTDRLSELQQRKAQLQQHEREILELAYLRRTNGFEAIRDAIRKLGELGSPNGVIARAPHEIGFGSEFDRLLLSEVQPGKLVPVGLWERGAEDSVPPRISIALEYPLIEHEVASNRNAQLVVVDEAGGRSAPALTEWLHWATYVVAPIVVESELIGLLHADASASGRAVDELDRDLLAEACTGLGEVFARAVLRSALRRHRAELNNAMAGLSEQLRSAARPPSGAEIATTGVAASLTPREREIVAWMARGRTNGQIAAALGVREGTVKYHVKNVLRKLGARSRADAVARYARWPGETT